MLKVPAVSVAHKNVMINYRIGKTMLHFRFTTFPQTGGCSEGLGAFRFFFKHHTQPIMRIEGRLF